MSGSSFIVFPEPLKAKHNTFLTDFRFRFVFDCKKIALFSGNLHNTVSFCIC